MVSAQAPLVAAVQLELEGVCKVVDMVGTPVRARSVAVPLLVEVVVVQLLPQPLQEPKLGADTVQLPEPETVQELLAVWLVVELEF
jgi:hypothetical protein